MVLCHHAYLLFLLKLLVFTLMADHAFVIMLISFFFIKLLQFTFVLPQNFVITLCSLLLIVDQTFKIIFSGKQFLMTLHCPNNW